MEGGEGRVRRRGSDGRRADSISNACVDAAVEFEVDAPPYALAFEFRNGKVVRWVLYPTQQEALEAAGLPE